LVCHGFSLNEQAMNRVWMAMGAYALLAALAWINLTAAIPDTKFQVRHVVLVILAGLAVSTWMHRRDREKNGTGNDGSDGDR
jgi:FtsH-binding integral membrane protein